MGEAVDVSYVLTDRNSNEPKSATYYFKVTVVAYEIAFDTEAAQNDTETQ